MRADIHAVQADRGSGHHPSDPPWSVQPRPGADDDCDGDRRVARRVSGSSRVGRIAVKEHVGEIGGRPAPVDDAFHDIVDQIGEKPCCRRRSDQGPEDIASGQGEQDDHGDDQQGESNWSQQGVDDSHHGADYAGWVVEPSEHGDLSRAGWARRGDRGGHDETDEADRDRQWPSARCMRSSGGQDLNGYHDRVRGGSARCPWSRLASVGALPVTDWHRSRSAQWMRPGKLPTRVRHTGQGRRYEAALVSRWCRLLRLRPVTTTVMTVVAARRRV